MNVTPEMHDAVCTLATKLAKAVYYKDSATIFPSGGCLILNWFSNSDLFSTGKYPIFELMKNLEGSTPSLVRSGKYLNDQFEYKFTVDQAKELIALQARFGASFGFVVFGSAVPEKLEAIIERIHSEVGGTPPFTVLQSSCATIRTIEGHRSLASLVKPPNVHHAGGDASDQLTLP